MNVVEEQRLRQTISRLESRVAELEARLARGGVTEHGDRVFFETARREGSSRMAAAMLGHSR